MGFSLQTWRYIGWVNEEELKDQEGCRDRLSPPQARNCHLQLQYITSLLSTWMQPTALFSNLMGLFCHFTRSEKTVAQLSKLLWMLFPHLKIKKKWCATPRVHQQRPVCGGPICSTVVLFFRPLQCDGISTEVCPINGSEPTWMLWWKRETCNLRGEDDARETAFLFVHIVDLDPFIPALSHCLHWVIILWIPTVWPIKRCV